MDEVWLQVAKAALADPLRPGGEDWGPIASRLGTDPARALGRLVPRGVVDRTDPYADLPDRATEQRLARGAAAIGRLAADPRAALDADDRAGIELLAHIAGRPAIPVADGRFAAPPRQWGFLTDRADVIARRLRSVGRLDAPAGTPIGTGFVVGPAAIMTNRHVARLLARDPVIDFGAGGIAIAAAPHYVSDDPAIDLAVLATDPAAPLPPPLAILPAAPDTTDGRVLYAIGYPALVEDARDAAVVRAVFGGELGIERLQPGLMRGLDADDPRRFAHDCSTLGGSSGSCLVDFETGLVCGLHYGSAPAINAAVALWAVPALAPFVRLG